MIQVHICNGDIGQQIVQANFLDCHFETMYWSDDFNLEGLNYVVKDNTFKLTEIDQSFTFSDRTCHVGNMYWDCLRMAHVDAKRLGDTLLANGFMISEVAEGSPWWDNFNTEIKQ